MGKLDGKVAIVAGGSRSIGKAIARGLAAGGAKTAIAARNAEKLNEAARELAGDSMSVFPIPAGVTDEAQVERLFQSTLAEFHRLDIFVNNAGSFDGGPLDQLPVETWDTVMAAILRGPFLCTRAAMRIMKPQGGGRILNIGSIAAQRPRPNSAPYTTSKAGIWGLTNVTALEGREFGISACCLHPRNVPLEDSVAQARRGSEPMMSAAELAEVAVLMASQPAHINMLEAIVLPVGQAYLGRGRYHHPLPPVAAATKFGSRDI
jgi:NAD(P)-dependent dehydrogenase (short-subunit alcohol dehydrogenase family)